MTLILNEKEEKQKKETHPVQDHKNQGLGKTKKIPRELLQDQEDHPQQDH